MTDWDFVTMILADTIYFDVSSEYIDTVGAYWKEEHPLYYSSATLLRPKYDEEWTGKKGYEYVYFTTSDAFYQFCITLNKSALKAGREPYEILNPTNDWLSGNRDGLKMGDIAMYVENGTAYSAGIYVGKINGHDSFVHLGGGSSDLGKVQPSVCISYHEDEGVIHPDGGTVNYNVYITFVITVMAVGIAVIFSCVYNIRKNGYYEYETEKVHLSMIKNQMNKENSSILSKNGGTVDRLGEYATFINKYLFLISEKSYESAYELYATDLVLKKGYIYSYDDFKSNCINFRNRIGIDGESSFFVAHYRSYIENENYVLVSLLVGRRQGGLYDNAISAEYTLIKSGNSYRILDFSYPDFDLYADKDFWEGCLHVNGKEYVYLHKLNLF